MPIHQVRQRLRATLSVLTACANPLSQDFTLPFPYRCAEIRRFGHMFIRIAHPNRLFVVECGDNLLASSSSARLRLPNVSAGKDSLYPWLAMTITAHQVFFSGMISNQYPSGSSMK